MFGAPRYPDPKSPTPRRCLGKMGKVQKWGNGGIWVEMGGNAGKWGEMRGNGGSRRGSKCGGFHALYTHSMRIARYFEDTLCEKASKLTPS